MAVTVVSTDVPQAVAFFEEVVRDVEPHGPQGLRASRMTAV